MKVELWDLPITGPSIEVPKNENFSMARELQYISDSRSMYGLSKVAVALSLWDVSGGNNRLQ